MAHPKSLRLLMLALLIFWLGVAALLCGCGGGGDAGANPDAGTHPPDCKAHPEQCQ